MRFLLPLLLVACADHDTTPQPVTATAPTIEESVEGMTLFQRLRDDAGPIAGLPGVSVAWTVDATHCGGVAVEAHRDPAAKISEEPILDILTIKFPTGLDFRVDNKAIKDASLAKFDAWVDRTMKAGKAARSTYEERVQTLKGRDKIVAAARLVQLQRYIASVFVRAEIPVDVRSGEFADEKTTAFCDRLAEVAEPIVILAEGSAKACQQIAAGHPPGWWTPVCKLRPPAVTASAFP